MAAVDVYVTSISIMDPVLYVSGSVQSTPINNVPVDRQAVDALPNDTTKRSFVAQKLVDRWTLEQSRTPILYRGVLGQTSIALPAMLPKEETNP